MPKSEYTYLSTKILSLYMNQKKPSEYTDSLYLAKKKKQLFLTCIQRYFTEFFH